MVRSQSLIPKLIPLNCSPLFGVGAFTVNVKPFKFKTTSSANIQIADPEEAGVQTIWLVNWYCPEFVIIIPSGGMLLILEAVWGAYSSLCFSV